MKPDFKSLSIVEIDLSAKVVLTDTIIEQIRIASPPDKDGDSIFYDYYKVENNVHVGWSVISSPAKDNKTCRFALYYQLGGFGRHKKNMPSISQALKILSSVNDPVELGCLSRFEFGKRYKAKTILSLPLILSESPNLPFDEIRGLHFSKVEERRSEYDIILDRDRDGRLTETVAFRHTTKIGDALVEDIISKAVEISTKFVFKEK